VVFNVQPKEKEAGKGSGVVHRRAASEAMKEQVLKAARAEHERLRLAQFSTPQTKPSNIRKEDDTLTPTLVHTVTTPNVKHTVGLDDDWNNSPASDKHSNADHEEGAIISRSPSRMSSFISNFKSMWRSKDRGKQQDQPRVVRFAFHVNTMSEKSPDDIVAEVQTVLKECGIPFTMKGKFCANCVVEGVHFSIEVCKIPRLSVNGIRFARISGSAWKYKTIVKDLVVHLKL